MDLTFSWYVMLPKFFDCVLLVRVGIPSLRKSGSSSLRGKLGAIVSWFLVCGPFAARGAKGEEEYP
jgi:hypothetical protein